MIHMREEGFGDGGGALIASVHVRELSGLTKLQSIVVQSKRYVVERLELRISS